MTLEDGFAKGIDVAVECDTSLNGLSNLDPSGTCQAITPWRVMISNRELQRVHLSQPLARMRHFAARLGWRGLQFEYATLPDDEATRGKIPNGIVIYYMTTDWKFNLQINTYPHGQCRTHRATVKAERYQILHVGWHDFELHEDNDKLDQEIERLRPWLYRSHFKDRTWRRITIRNCQ